MTTETNIPLGATRTDPKSKIVAFRFRGNKLVNRAKLPTRYASNYTYYGDSNKREIKEGVACLTVLAVVRDDVNPQVNRKASRFVPVINIFGAPEKRVPYFVDVPDMSLFRAALGSSASDVVFRTLISRQEGGFSTTLDSRQALEGTLLAPLFRALSGRTSFNEVNADPFLSEIARNPFLTEARTNELLERSMKSKKTNLMSTKIHQKGFTPYSAIAMQNFFSVCEALRSGRDSDRLQTIFAKDIAKPYVFKAETSEKSVAEILKVPVAEKKIDKVAVDSTGQKKTIVYNDGSTETLFKDGVSATETNLKDTDKEEKTMTQKVSEVLSETASNLAKPHRTIDALSEAFKVGAQTAVADEAANAILGVAEALVGDAYPELAKTEQGKLLMKLMAATVLHHVADANVPFIPEKEATKYACSLVMEAATRDLVQPKIAIITPAITSLAAVGRMAIAGNK